MTTTARRGRLTGGRLSVGAALTAAMSIVVVVCVLSALGIAVLLAPGIFHDHLHQAGIDQDSAQAVHVERAFTDAVGLAWGVAAAVAAVVALGITWYMARRVQRMVTAVAMSAGRIADGRYDTRVDGHGMGREFAELADSVNRLAARLDETESTRRAMLSDLAHEMRTPLATIDSYLEAIDDGVREPDAETMAILHQGTDRLRRLAEDVSAVSRAQEGVLSVVPRPVPAKRLLESAAAEFAGGYDAKGVELRVRPTSHAVLHVDPARLGQVLGNLLNNALRHTPPGGTVTLAATDSGPDVLVTVSDTGAGIAAEHLPHVFDRFYRADSARDRDHGGSGIGLTIVAALVAAHGGSVSAASDGPGRGATFTVRLPIGRFDGTVTLDS